MMILYRWMHGHPGRMLLFHIPLIAILGFVAFLLTLQFYHLLGGDKPSYHYEGSGIFDSAIGVKIWEKSSSTDQQAPVERISDNRIFVMYSFDDSQPHKFGLEPLKVNKEDRFVYFPAALIGIATVAIPAVIVGVSYNEYAEKR